MDEILDDLMASLRDLLHDTTRVDPASVSVVSDIAPGMPGIIGFTMDGQPFSVTLSRGE